MKFVAALIFVYLVCSGQVSEGQQQQGGTWCVARPSATDVELTNNINYACQTLAGSNCTLLIEEGGSCRDPCTLINHASAVMNAYYAENGRNWWNCNFKGTGLITISNPSN
uniref:X8 domain-containing protein n=1 Tax=Kalanchoe fedtschenkoi TaxID=63787 RepID=A0A7N0U0D1_KALFE